MSLKYDERQLHTIYNSLEYICLLSLIIPKGLIETLKEQKILKLG